MSKQNFSSIANIKCTPSDRQMYRVWLRPGSAAPYCYVIKSVTNLVAVTDNMVGLVGKVQLF